MNKNQFKRRLIIGSANFLNRYGLNNFKVSYKEIKKIANLAKKNNILYIDTAEDYLRNRKIFKKINNKFKFTTKISPDTDWLSLEFCQKKLENHFGKFNNNKIETLFLHDYKVLLTKNGNKIFKNLEYLKKKKLFKKIGLSIYDTKNLNYIFFNYKVDVIQCPYNIFDKRILNTGWFDKMKKLEIEVHARSIFLQGLLINKSFHTKKYFKIWEKSISKWFKWLKENNISATDYCLTDLLATDFDKIIIGINNSANLREILHFRKINKNKLLNMETNDLRLIDPRKWK